MDIRPDDQPRSGTSPDAIPSVEDRQRENGGRWLGTGHSGTPLTHASFFSGAGGTDLGLESAGWRTVSFSEIDPYASQVLAERWPGVPNLGDITLLRTEPAGRVADERGGDAVDDGGWQAGGGLPRSSANATLWSGGFPCQDLSVAGKRAGFGLQQHGREPKSGLRADQPVAANRKRAGDTVSASGADRPTFDAATRSGLAFAFLDLVEQYRPPAVLLENVPGLLSSHAGRDFGTLLGRLGELRYGWAYRILDARHFGVPQRRRRVFILALDLDRGFSAERAAAVLSVGSRCDRHPAAGVAAGPGVAERTVPGVDIARAVTGTAWKRRDDDTDTLIGPPPDPGGVRATDGLAGRTHDQPDLAPTLRVGPAKAADGGPGDTVPIVTALRASGNGNDLSAGDDGRLIAATLNSGGNSGGFRTEPGEHLVASPISASHSSPRGDGGDNLVAFVKRGRAQSSEDDESWGEGEVMPTPNSFDVGDVRTTAAIVTPFTQNQRDELRTLDQAGALGGQGTHQTNYLAGATGFADDPLLPLGLDSHRYRCCGNGVVAPVAEWIGARLAEALA